MKVADVKKKHEKKLLKKANVVGVMTGYKTRGGKKTGELSIVCMVEEKVSKKELKRRDLVPAEIEGVVTDVIQVGRIRALQIDKTARHRPCPLGTSGGHYMITAGTNGELLIDRETGVTCIGTNNHVGANCNDAQIGDVYLQPAPWDGGTIQNDTIGTLLRFVPIKFSELGEGGDDGLCKVVKSLSWSFNSLARVLGRKTWLKPIRGGVEYNLIDGALIYVNEKDVTAEIVDIGVPKGIGQAQLKMLVQKSGRTTCHTTGGLILGIDAMVGPIHYGNQGIAYFKNQIVISKPGFCWGGDSGSLILDMDGHAIGKLFAGSQWATIANHIGDYLELLNAELVT